MLSNHEESGTVPGTKCASVQAIAALGASFLFLSLLVQVTSSGLTVGMQDRQKRRARAGLVHVSRVTPREHDRVHPTHPNRTKKRKNLGLSSLFLSCRADVRDILVGPVLSSPSLGMQCQTILVSVRLDLVLLRSCILQWK